MKLGQSPLLLLLLVLVSSWQRGQAYEIKEGAYHVAPSDDIQQALDAAATNSLIKTVEIEEGTYQPKRPGLAFVYLIRRHDGIHLKGVGRVVLTAANPAVASNSNPAYPAVVNHILYLGDGLSTNTVVEHLRLTGANHFLSSGAPIEPDIELKKGRFYYGDGGAIKIYHRSSPVLRQIEITNNYASPCAGGISIQQEGANQQAVLIEDCVFFQNRAEVTGGALDLLWGSSARVINCLFVGNASNTGPGEGYNPFTNNGVVTVFPRSKLEMERCTFAANRNGVDDMSGLGRYSRCVFYRDQVEGGPPGQQRFELALQLGGILENCVIVGRMQAPHLSSVETNNLLNPPGFSLTPDYLQGGAEFSNIGYRPAGSNETAHVFNPHSER